MCGCGRRRFRGSAYRPVRQSEPRRARLANRTSQQQRQTEAAVSLAYDAGAWKAQVETRLAQSVRKGEETRAGGRKGGPPPRRLQAWAQEGRGYRNGSRTAPHPPSRVSLPKLTLETGPRSVSLKDEVVQRAAEGCFVNTKSTDVPRDLHTPSLPRSNPSSEGRLHVAEHCK